MPASRSLRDHPANLHIPLDDPTQSSSPTIPAKRLKRSDSGDLSATFEEAVRASSDDEFLLSPVAASTEDIGALASGPHSLASRMQLCSARLFRLATVWPWFESLLDSRCKAMSGLISAVARDIPRGPRLSPRPPPNADTGQCSTVAQSRPARRTVPAPRSCTQRSPGRRPAARSAVHLSWRRSPLLASRLATSRGR